MQYLLKRFFYPFLILFITGSLSILETLAYRKDGIYSVIASRIWLIWGMFFLLYILVWFAKQMFADIKQKKFWGILALLFVMTLLSFNLENFPILLSGDTTQQLAAGLANWQKSDLGYTETAFLGFPSRQYLLTSVPTLLWGISIVNNRLMYLLIFFLGIITFYTGIRTYYNHHPQNGQIAALAILAIPAFPAVQLLSRLFDMPILPLSFFLQTIGIFLIALNTQSLLAILALSFSITMLANTYTPALSAWALSIGVIFAIVFYYFIRNKTLYQRFTSALPWATCGILALTFGLNSITHRMDLRIAKTATVFTQESFAKLAEVLNYTFISNNKMYGNHLPFVGHAMFLPVVVFLVGGLLYFWGFRYLIISIWVIATLVIAGLSHGYSNPPIDDAMYRVLVIIPPILLGIVDIIFNKQVIISSKIFYLLFICFVIYNLSITYLLYNAWSKENDFRNIVVREALKSAKKYAIPLDQPIQLGTFTAHPEIQFFHEHLKYFFPKYRQLSNKISCLDGFDYSTNAIFFFDEATCGKDFLKQDNKFITEIFIYPQRQIHGVRKAVYKI